MGSHDIVAAIAGDVANTNVHRVVGHNFVIEKRKGSVTIAEEDTHHAGANVMGGGNVWHAVGIEITGSHAVRVGANTIGHHWFQRAVAAPQKHTRRGTRGVCHRDIVVSVGIEVRDGDRTGITGR